MVTVISRFRVRNGLEQDVRTAFLNRPRLVENTSGFCGLDVLTDAKDPSIFLLLTRWQDEDSFQVWHRSDAHHQSHEFMPRGLKLDAAFTSLTVGHGLPRPGGAHNLNDALEGETLAISDWLMKSKLVVALLLSPDGTIHMRNLAAGAILPDPAPGDTIWQYVDDSDARSLQRNISHPDAGQVSPWLLKLAAKNQGSVNLQYEVIRCNGAVLFMATEVESL